VHQLGAGNKRGRLPPSRRWELMALQSVKIKELDVNARIERQIDQQ